MLDLAFLICKTIRTSGFTQVYFSEHRYDEKMSNKIHTLFLPFLPLRVEFVFEMKVVPRLKELRSKSFHNFTILCKFWLARAKHTDKLKTSSFLKSFKYDLYMHQKIG